MSWVNFCEKLKPRDPVSGPRGFFVGALGMLANHAEAPRVPRATLEVVLELGAIVFEERKTAEIRIAG
jgi:hypothetical protein